MIMSLKKYITLLKDLSDFFNSFVSPSDDEMGMGGNMYTAVLALVFLFIFLSFGAFLFTLWEVSYAIFFRGIQSVPYHIRLSPIFNAKIRT